MDVVVAVKTLISSVICIYFLIGILFFLSSVFIFFSTVSCPLASIVACKISNYVSDSLSISLTPFEILNLEVLRAVLYGADER